MSHRLPRREGWSRAKKQALVVGDWEKLHQLARPRTTVDRASSSGQPGLAPQTPAANKDDSEVLASSFDYAPYD